MRIVSVVPSLTELLFDLNLDNQIVGVTRFCIHPKAKTKAILKIGGTKNLKIQKIIDLKPDLIVANKEENERSDIEELQKHCVVWVTDILTIADALKVIITLGKKTNTEILAQSLVSKIKNEFEGLHKLNSEEPRNTAYLIWNDPIMLAGRKTFIQDMLEQIGCNNILKDSASRYPISSIEELKALNPNYIFLSSEPYPFKEKHQLAFQKALPNSKVLLVDGEMFSWYGSRMAKAPNYFNKLVDTLKETID
tara:strand:+ start:25349 stop:26101 length:753 start_codon:yes stop_codon:yes gene_type:complete